jgi:hypothetical protein
MFFSEEKNQKTFMSCAGGEEAVPAGKRVDAENP